MSGYDWSILHAGAAASVKLANLTPQCSFPRPLFRLLSHTNFKPDTP